MNTIKTQLTFLRSIFQYKERKREIGREKHRKKQRQRETEKHTEIYNKIKWTTWLGSNLNVQLSILPLKLLRFVKYSTAY